MRLFFIPFLLLAFIACFTSCNSIGSFLEKGGEESITLDLKEKHIQSPTGA